MPFWCCSAADLLFVSAVSAVSAVSVAVLVICCGVPLQYLCFSALLAAAFELCCGAACLMIPPHPVRACRLAASRRCFCILPPPSASAGLPAFCLIWYSPGSGIITVPGTAPFWHALAYSPRSSSIPLQQPPCIHSLTSASALLHSPPCLPRRRPQARQYRCPWFRTVPCRSPGFLRRPDRQAGSPCRVHRSRQKHHPGTVLKSGFLHRTRLLQSSSRALASCSRSDPHAGHTTADHRPWPLLHQMYANKRHYGCFSAQLRGKLEKLQKLFAPGGI